MSLVNVSIVGNLIKAPEQFSFKSGRVKTTLVVAVDTPNRRPDNENKFDTEIYRVEAWGKLGEVAHKYLAKGNLVGATGRLVMNHWQDREGRNRVTPTVEASQIALPPKPKGNFIAPKANNLVGGELQFDGPDENSNKLVVVSGTKDGDSTTAGQSTCEFESNAQDDGPPDTAEEEYRDDSEGGVVAEPIANYGSGRTREVETAISEFAGEHASAVHARRTRRIDNVILYDFANQSDGDEDDDGSDPDDDDEADQRSPDRAPDSSNEQWVPLRHTIRRRG